MSSKPLQRPEPGTVTEREVRVPLCTECGQRVKLGMCSFGCDANIDNLKHIFYAVYRVTEVFLRDEGL